MNDINRINRYHGIYPDHQKKVKETSKDEKNKQQGSKKEETFKDVFERTKKEEKR